MRPVDLARLGDARRKVGHACEVGADELLERRPRDAQDVAEVDDRQTGRAAQRPPLLGEGVGLGAPDPQHVAASSTVYSAGAASPHNNRLLLSVRLRDCTTSHNVRTVAIQPPDGIDF